MEFEYKILNKKEVEILKYLGKEELLIIPSFVFIENKIYKVISIAQYALSNSYVKKIFIPYTNSCDLEEIPEVVKEKVKIILVKNYKEIFNALFK